MTRLIVPLGIALIVMVAGGRASGADITTCGDTVAAGTTGVLQADLDCSASPFGVRLLPGATLDLNGHAIAGGDSTSATVVGVGAEDGSGRGFFTILGPGEISGTSRNYNTPSGTWACVQVSDGKARIAGGAGIVDIHGCIYGILGSAGDDPNGRAKVALDNVTLHGLLFDGAAVAAVVASHVTASDNGGQGIGAARNAKLTDVVARNNIHGHGLFAGTNMRGSHISASGNYNGVEAWRTLKLLDLTSTDNAFSGAAARSRLFLVNSTVTGNGTTDILSGTPPRLVNTTCGKSLSYDSTSWHACNGSPSGAFLDLGTP